MNALTLILFVVVSSTQLDDSAPAIDTSADQSGSNSRQASIPIPATRSVRDSLRQRTPAPFVVTITQERTFQPSRIFIPAGSTILWRNTTRDKLTITNISGLALDRSSTLRPIGAMPFHKDYLMPGKTFEQTFAIPGVYRYFCLEHEKDGMVGEIVVR